LRWREGPEVRGRVLAELAISTALVVLACSWWLAIMLRQVHAGNANIGWIAPLGPGQILAVFIRDGFPERILDFKDVPAYVIGLGLLGEALYRGRRARLVQVGALMVFLALAAWCACALVQPVVTWGTVLWPMGLVAMVLSCGLASVDHTGLRRALVALMLGMLAFNLAQHRHAFATEDWRRALAMAAKLPSSAVVVEHEAMAAVLERACHQQFSTARCPFAVVAIRSDNRSDAWALGLAQISLVSREEARARLAGLAHVYALHHAGYDPLLHLGMTGLAPRRSPSDPFVEGPFLGNNLVLPPRS
jgi:hypothetical protein